MSPLCQDLAGEMLGHYRLDDYIGVGGMGTVFRATDLRLDRPVALKILPPDQAKDPDVVARFQHEARAAARLEHENVARVFDVGEDRGLHFIAFEYVDGANLRDLIRARGPLPPEEVVNYAIQIAGALVHAAAQGVVHRDIKPSNIIVTALGRAKLVDMGLARNFERRRDGGLTQSGVTLGTFDYIAPEQARDPRAADARSDIYALGCTLYHMLTGRPPYPDGTVLQKLLKHQGDELPDVRQLAPGAPEPLAALVRRMMAKDPARRYQTPEDLVAELFEIAAALGLRSTTPEGLIWMTDRPRSYASLAAWGIWAASAAGFVIAVVLLYGRPGAPPAPLARAGGAAAADGSAADGAGPRVEIAATPAAGAGTTTPPPQGPVGVTPAAARTGDEPPAAVAEPAAHAAPVPSEMPVLHVARDQDLRRVLQEAPSGSVVEISGDYRPQAFHIIDDTAGIRIEGKRLVLRAAPGSRSRVVLHYDDDAVRVADWTLFTLVGSQVEFEGISFETDSTAAGEAGRAVDPLVMLALESSQVTLRRCGFFQVTKQTGSPRSKRSPEPSAWVAQLDGGIATSGEATGSSIRAEECFFGGGQTGFVLKGPARLELQDCTLLPYRAAVVVNSFGYPQTVAARVGLAHVSLFGSGDPVIDLQFARAVVDARDCVFSHEGPQHGTLVRSDASSQVEWSGKNNLFHAVSGFLIARSAADWVTRAGGLAEWKQLAPDVHEDDSTETDTSPWVISLERAAEMEEANPSDLHVADAFRLKRHGDNPDWRPVGARTVLPWGSLYPAGALELTSVRSAASPGAAAPAPAAAAEPRAASDAVPDKGTKDRPPKTASAAGGSASVATPAAASSPAAVEPPEPEPMRVPNMKSVINTTGGDTPPAGARPASLPGPDAPRGAEAAPHAAAAVVDPSSRTAYHSLAEACARSDDGALIEIRYSGKLIEEPIELGDRHLIIAAADGFRPTVQLHADRLDLEGREPRLFSIRRGSLTLRGIDFLISADPAVSAEPWGLVASRGADVIIESCTARLEAPAGLTTVLVRFLPQDGDDPMMAPSEPAAGNRTQLRLSSMLLVGSGSVVRIQPAGRVRIEVDNCAIAVQDAFCVLASGNDRLLAGASNELEFRGSSVETHRGLIQCDAPDLRPWLPAIDVTAMGNLFWSDASTPWISLRSPRPAEEMRVLVHWKGINNTYLNVGVPLVAESVAPGGESERYDWSRWLGFPGREEPTAEYRSSLELPDASLPVWQLTRNHFSWEPLLGPGEAASSGRHQGADLTRLPDVPGAAAPSTGP